MRYEDQQQRILQVIDYINHMTPAKATVSGLYRCSNHSYLMEPDYPAFFPKGQVTFYNKGYLPVEDDIFLDKPKHLNFPLSDFHNYFSHNNTNHIVPPTKSLVNEPSYVSRLLYKSKDWEIFDISLELIDLYVGCFLIKKDLINAAIDFNHWYNAVHSTPDYSEEEQKADPFKKWVMDGEKEITERPKKIIFEGAQKINAFYDALTQNGLRELPARYTSYFDKDRFEITDEVLLKSKLSFIYNTYQTFKAKNIFFSNQKRIEAINEIDAILESSKKISDSSPF